MFRLFNPDLVTQNSLTPYIVTDDESAVIELIGYFMPTISFK